MKYVSKKPNNDYDTNTNDNNGNEIKKINIENNNNCDNNGEIKNVNINNKKHRKRGVGLLSRYYGNNYLNFDKLKIIESNNKILDYDNIKKEYNKHTTNIIYKKIYEEYQKVISTLKFYFVLCDNSNINLPSNTDLYAIKEELKNYMIIKRGGHERIETNTKFIKYLHVVDNEIYLLDGEILFVSNKFIIVYNPEIKKEHKIYNLTPIFKKIYINDLISF